MAYQSWSVVFGEQPSASKWNILGTNDASFNDGSGIADDAIINRHLADDSVTGNNLSLTQQAYELASSFATSSTTYVDSGIKVTLPDAGIYLVIASLRCSSAAANDFGTVRLYNQTTAAEVTDSDMISSYSAAGAVQQNTTIVKTVTTATANNIIRVDVKAGGAWTTSILSDGSGASRLFAVRIG
ncbi:MAG: hypothetical protein WC822_05640 [Candidatus Paceibacterota bacterium]|jgi:hypothetical protein